MAPQLNMDTSSPMATLTGSNDSTQMLLTTQLYRSALHRQGLLLETQEDLRRIVLHDGLVSGLKDYLKKVQPTCVNRKRRTVEEKPEDVEQKLMQAEFKKVKIVITPRVNRKRQSNDNINFAVEKKKIRPNEKEVVEEKKWKAEPVEPKETKTNYEDPFGMDDLFAQLQIKQ